MTQSPIFCGTKTSCQNMRAIARFARNAANQSQMILFAEFAANVTTTTVSKQYKPTDMWRASDMAISLAPECVDCTGNCFARRNGKCMILLTASANCSFKKASKEFTNGILYPYNPASCDGHENKTHGRVITGEQWRAARGM